MKAARLALAMTAAATLAAGALFAVPAQAATGDVWTDFKVVDVTPAATTQKVILGGMPRYEQPGDDLYLWNIVRMVEDKNGNTSWVYCIQQKVQGDAPSYQEDPINGGTAAGRADIARINRVLADSTLPAPGALEVTAPNALVSAANNVLPKNKVDNIEITAVQLALWHYTDGINPTAANLTWDKTYYPDSFNGDAKNTTIAEVLARYNALVAAAEANPLTNPVPEITVTPADSTIGAGTSVVLTVTGKDIEGGITLTTDDASVTVYAVAPDDTCDTSTPITSLPSAGGKACVTSAAVGSVKVTASGASAGSTTHTLYAQNAQSVIAIGPDPASDSATVEWTAVETTSTPSPSETPSSTPSGSTTSTPTVSETSSTGGAVVETSDTAEGNDNGDADAPSGALADTGAMGLLDRLAFALAALALGTAFVVVTRRRAQRTH